MEFWNQFERELRAKQLAALMARRPWWQRLPSVGPFFVRHRILIGASAVLAVTVISLRNPRQPVMSVASAERVTSPATVVGVPVSVAMSGSSRAADRTVATTERTATLALADTGTRIVAPTDLVIVTTKVGNAVAVALVPQLGAIGPVAETEFQASVSRFVATTLTAAVPVEGSTTRVIGSGFEAWVMPARTTVEPLHQMISPSETRRAKLLTAMVSMASLENSARATERVANRIDDERLYEQVSRFGARGDRLNVKF